MTALPAGRGRFTAVTGLIVAGALVLSGCAAGKKAPTSEESPAIDGTGVAVGTMLLQAIAIAPPPNGPSYAQGDSADLRLSIINNGRTPDTLTGVTASAAGSVSATGASGDLCSPASSPTDTGAVSSAGTRSAGGSAGSGSAGVSTSSSSGAAPGSAGGSSSGAAAFTPITVSPTCRIAFGMGGGPQLVLNSLKTQLFPAAVVTVTFTFQNAGSVTAEVPVQLTTTAPSAPVVTAGLTPETSATE